MRALHPAQIILGFWTEWHPWVISLVFLFFLLSVNMIHVRVYGELGKESSHDILPISRAPTNHPFFRSCRTIAPKEYWLSVLKVITIVIFIILGIAVNAGGNRHHHYIGGENWRIGDAPFVDGFRGFASGKSFVSCSPKRPLARKLTRSFFFLQYS